MKQIIKYGKGKLIVGLLFFFLGWLFIDKLGWTYLYFALCAKPLHFLISYSVDKWVFKK